MQCCCLSEHSLRTVICAQCSAETKRGNKDKEPEVDMIKVLHKATQPECVRPIADSQTSGISYEKCETFFLFSVSFFFFSSAVGAVCGHFNSKSFLVLLFAVPLASQCDCLIFQQELFHKVPLTSCQFVRVALITSNCLLYFK